MPGCHAATVTRCDNMADFGVCPCSGYSVAGEPFDACPCRTFTQGSSRLLNKFFPLFIAFARHDGLCSRVVFTYNLSVYDVVILNVVAYESCVLPKGAIVMRKRNKVQLHRGTHYFICIV